MCDPGEQHAVVTGEPAAPKGCTAGSGRGPLEKGPPSGNLASGLPVLLHGRADTVGVRLRHAGGQVRLEVNDHSPSAVPTSTRVGLDSEGGRGLWLVGSLVDELGGTWGFTADGTVAWCVFPSTPRSPYESRERHPKDDGGGLGSRRGRR
jgi:hypothetical protein